MLKLGQKYVTFTKERPRDIRKKAEIKIIQKFHITEKSNDIYILAKWGILALG